MMGREKEGGYIGVEEWEKNMKRRKGTFTKKTMAA